MQQLTTHTLRALILSALLTTSGMALAATPTSVSTANTMPHNATTSATQPSVNTTTTPQVTARTNNTVVNQQLHTGVVTSPKNIQDVRPYIFSDVPSDFWAAKSISAVAKAKLMKGYADGTFRPNQPMTREEVASLFNNITDDGEAAFISSHFKDITSDRWSALAIESVARKNIISGYGDETYKPEKFMSRQEFAVVADNYLHYLGYTTDDPTVLDQVAYGDQKFVAPWAQDAVRELGYLGFTNYAPGTMFNPEKYVTRAEAAEISYRMTQTPQALAFHNALYRQQVERKTASIISHALHFGQDFTQFRNDGALFWKEGKLHVTVVDKKQFDAVNTALSEAHDPQLNTALIVGQGKLTQAQLEDFQSDALAMYQSKEPKGKIISILPNDDASVLIITADSVQDGTVKAFKKKFGKKVIVQTPPEEMPSTTIQFPLPLKPTK